MKTRPTILDVAKTAGVSKSTVSLVLQNSPKVKQETVKTVRKAMQEIGYVYNRSAAQLRSAKTGLVGMVINELRNPFFTEIATALQMAFSERNYATVIANVDENPELQNQVINAMIEHGVSGLVISPTPTTDVSAFENLTRHLIPTLQIMRTEVKDTVNYPVISPDNVYGTKLATEHLVAQGARRIAFVGGKSSISATMERKEGCFLALQAINQEPLVFEGRSSREFGHEMAIRLYNDYPEVDGVVCFNDLVALGMLSGCARIGRKVGQDFKITGFDDIRECAQSFPSLSSVSCHIEDFGQTVAQTMLDWIEKGQKPAPEMRTQVDLIARASSGGE